MAQGRTMNGEERMGREAMSADAMGTEKMGREAIENLASKAKDQGERLMKNASDTVCNVSGQLADSACDAKVMVGDKMSSLASTIREKAPQQGKMGSAASAVADTLENSGTYLAGKDFSQMADDITSIVKKYPVQALAGGFVLGLLARSLVTSSRK